MIVVKHRWRKNHNVTVGSTTLSFDDKGIARVRHIGNAIADVDACIRHSKGLIGFVEDPRKPKVVQNPFPAVTVPEP